MGEELDQIENNDTWELVPRPHDKNVIGTKWIFKNKLNENGEVIRIKARLVSKGYLQQQGFTKGSADIKLYTNIENDKILIVVVYVDDIIFGSNEESMSRNFASVMQQELEMSLLGELTYFLGLQEQQTKDGIFLSQTKYLKQILKKYGMEDSKPVCTPMVRGCTLSSSDESLTVNQPAYKSMIGSLIYLIGTKQDIMHAKGIVGWFQANPKESHLQVVTKIFKYLQGTQDFGLWYPKDTNLTLGAYIDADLEGNVDD
eukprot:PITA_04887